MNFQNKYINLCNVSSLIINYLNKQITTNLTVRKCGVQELNSTCQQSARLQSYHAVKYNDNATAMKFDYSNVMLQVYLFSLDLN